jgi:hypothetical protein
MKTLAQAEQLIHGSLGTVMEKEAKFITNNNYIFL